MQLPKSEPRIDATQEACVRAFSEEFDYVYWTFRRYGVTAAEAEDLAQDVFMVLWRRRDELQTDRRLRPWLAGVAFHLANKHLVRRRRERSGVSDEVRDGAPLPDEGLSSARDRDLSRRAIASLPERHRVALVMHELDGVPMRELAEQWSVPLFTAYTRVRVAKKAFARAVTELQQGPDGGHGDKRAPEALLEMERTPPAAPAETRRRAVARARALLLVPEDLWPRSISSSHGESTVQPGWASSGSPFAHLGIAVGLGVAVLVAVLASRRHGEPAAGSEALAVSAADDHVAAALPASTPPALSVRRSAPRFLAVAPAPAPVPGVRDEDDPRGGLLARGLLGQWRFEWGGRVRDSSGNGFDCTTFPVGGRPAWTDGRKGGAARFFGGSWMECPQPEIAARAAMAMTVAVWLNPTDLRSLHRAVVSRGMDGGWGELFFLGLGGDKLILRSSPWRAKLVHAFPNNPGHWVHLAFTHAEDGTTRLFVDGAQVAETKAPPGRSGMVRTPLVVGAGVNHQPGTERQPRPGQRFTGVVDEVVVYDRALSTEEIAWLAAAVSPARD
jgi:RNA polymerase sigma factor (sigma-70 family)